MFNTNCLVNPVGMTWISSCKSYKSTIKK